MLVELPVGTTAGLPATSNTSFKALAFLLLLLDIVAGRQTRNAGKKLERCRRAVDFRNRSL